jgi:hypothetical protein
MRRHVFIELTLTLSRRRSHHYTLSIPIPSTKKPGQTPSLSQLSATAALFRRQRYHGRRLLADYERFSEEAPIEHRSEEGAADFKRMLEEMSR